MKNFMKLAKENKIKEGKLEFQFLEVVLPGDIKTKVKCREIQL